MALPTDTELSDRLASAEAQIAALACTITELKQALSTALSENEALKLENKELKTRLGLNSENSSKPPSSDGLQKKPAFPRVPKGPRGGQAKHKGSTLAMSPAPDTIVPCRLEFCACGCCLEGVPSQVVGRRQVFDIPQPKLQVTEYQLHMSRCPQCHAACRGSFPKAAAAPTQYGAQVKALLVYLHNYIMVPYSKISELFLQLFGIRLNEGTVYNNDSDCYERLAPVEMYILCQLLQSACAHSDETGMRCEGVLKWLHVFSSNFFTYLFLHSKRGREAILSGASALSKYCGWLVHDCWSSYFQLGGVKHAICGAHILRELQCQIEDKSRWAAKFKEFLLRTKDTALLERLAGRSQIETEYKAIIAEGEQEEPPAAKTGKKGRMKRTKGRNLLERLAKYQNEVLAFAFNAEVPFTNNQAERDIRPSKLKQKIAGCFRSATGGDMFARIYGFISSVKKHGQNVFNELCNLFEGRPIVWTYQAK